MPEAVLVSALRTPIGTAFKGSLRDTTAFDLADTWSARRPKVSTPP
jgi:acetyl-CoA C-acetyltransferase